jgi:hypothetical protein
MGIASAACARPSDIAATLRATTSTSTTGGFAIPALYHRRPGAGQGTPDPVARVSRREDLLARIRAPRPTPRHTALSGYRAF